MSESQKFRGTIYVATDEAISRGANPEKFWLVVQKYRAPSGSVVPLKQHNISIECGLTNEGFLIRDSAYQIVFEWSPDDGESFTRRLLWEVLSMDSTLHFKREDILGSDLDYKTITFSELKRRQEVMQNIRATMDAGFRWSTHKDAILSIWVYTDESIGHFAPSLRDERRKTFFVAHQDDVSTKAPFGAYSCLLVGARKFRTRSDADGSGQERLKRRNLVALLEDDHGIEPDAQLVPLPGLKEISLRQLKDRSDELNCAEPLADSFRPVLLHPEEGRLFRQHSFLIYKDIPVQFRTGLGWFEHKVSFYKNPAEGQLAGGDYETIQVVCTTQPLAFPSFTIVRTDSDPKAPFPWILRTRDGRDQALGHAYETAYGAYLSGITRYWSQSV